MPLQNPQDVAAHAALPSVHHTLTEIATGTYTGDGGTGGRQITTGFLPKFVWLKHAGAVNTWSMEGQDSARSILISANPADKTDVHLHATNGFVVGDGDVGGNANLETYYWWAIKG